MSEIVATYKIDEKIYLLRGHKVMLDSDLASLYGVELRVLNQAAQRNLERFPPDFMFRISKEEHKVLRSQIVILEKGRGRYSKYLPCVFTEQGVAMLSGVLHSKRAIRANIEIMRAFVRLRQVLSLHKDLARKLETLEKTVAGHEENFRAVFEAIRELMKAPEKPTRRIGFTAEERRARYRAR